MERKIVKIGDEGLRKICKPVERFDLRLAILLKDMADTMHDADGVGLAAPQIGIVRRVVVIDVGDEHGVIELVNPVITERSEETQTGREGCLSLPNRQGIVTRPMRVKVHAQDRHGRPFDLEGEGLLARAICHELDHLDGHLFTEIVEEFVEVEDIK